MKKPLYTFYVVSVNGTTHFVEIVCNANGKRVLKHAQRATRHGVMITKLSRAIKEGRTVTKYVTGAQFAKLVG